MKKVLLIGYPFPYRSGGSPRLLGLAKYLPEFGWEPVILTAPLDEKADKRYTIIETGYRPPLVFLGKLLKLNAKDDIRKQIRTRFGVKAKKSLLDYLMTFGGEIINYPDSEKSWKPYAVTKGKELLNKEMFKAILSTSAPLTTHIIARALKSQYKIPWVADLRDLWTQNHNYSYSRLRKFIDRRLELKTLGAADALVTVSQPWAEKLHMLHRDKETYSITNGFDPETLMGTPVKPAELFTITYTGIIYAGKQDVTLLFAALKELIAEKAVAPEKIEIRFYGPREEWLDKEAGQYGLTKILHQYGPVPRPQALQSQRESHILLLLNWNDPAENGTIPAKIFEYMAARRPVLALGGGKDDAVQQILFETKIGYHGTGVKGVKEWLFQRYTEYLASGNVPVTGDEKAIQRYSQQEMARKFAEILDKLSEPVRQSNQES